MPDAEIRPYTLHPPPISYLLVATRSRRTGYVAIFSHLLRPSMPASPDVLYRKAQKFLQSAAVLFELEDFDSCASRAYFAMFFAAQAVLLQEGVTVSSRQGIRSAFVEAFVESGRLPDRAGAAFMQAADLQEVADYAQHFAVDEAAAERVLQESEAFVHTMARLLAADPAA